MSKGAASVLFGCLAALPLIGCAGNMATTAQAPPPIADSSAYYAGVPRVYTAGPAAPAAVLVVLPSAMSAEDVLFRDPRLWATQGFDVIAPQPDRLFQLVADQQAALARLVASARR